MLSPALFVTYNFCTVAFWSAPAAVVNTRTPRQGMSFPMNSAPSRFPTRDRVQPRAEHVRPCYPRAGRNASGWRSNGGSALWEAVEVVGYEVRTYFIGRLPLARTAAIDFAHAPLLPETPRRRSA